MRGDRIIIRMTPEEKERVVAKAATLGLNLSSYIRYLIAKETQTQNVNLPIDNE